MASARRPNFLAVMFGAGLLLFAGGLGMVVADAQARIDAAESAISFTAEEREYFGGDIETTVESVRLGALFSSMYTGADVSKYEVEVEDARDGSSSTSIYPVTYRVILALNQGWHATPVTLPAFAGLALTVGALFLGAARWHRRAVRRSRN
ncbi:hypothetical protein D9V28_15755 [Mycetocola zhadangensis]|uniref:Uncharacterized protein n=1 Tax=Mycetocola zhadangensis TaxID=1164595 RepID=A0A3L7ISM8_9MICO|nr:hypothetical protein D9V28_15755 [Mycetocola zhadangensis]GGF05504.1 hypothetical protein GCM10011313_30810 [Mycetocola zhadangensis]